MLSAKEIQDLFREMHGIKQFDARGEPSYALKWWISAEFLLQFNIRIQSCSSSGGGWVDCEVSDLPTSIAALWLALRQSFEAWFAGGEWVLPEGLR